ncbi:hypothetical protein ABK040_003904 [Willaertia magna]
MAKKKEKKPKAPLKERLKVGWKKFERKDKIFFYLTMLFSVLSLILNIAVGAWGFGIYASTNSNASKLGNNKECLNIYLNNLMVVIAIIEMVSAALSFVHISVFTFEILYYSAKTKPKKNIISSLFLLGKAALGSTLLFAYITLLTYTSKLNCRVANPDLYNKALGYVIGGWLIWGVSVVFGFTTFHLNVGLITCLKSVVFGDEDGDEEEEEEEENEELEEKKNEETNLPKE